MKSLTIRGFRESYASLPVLIQNQARDAYRMFVANPLHPGLRFRRISGAKNVCSVRINSDYRAIGVLDGDTVIWFWIGSHSDYDKLLANG